MIGISQSGETRDTIQAMQLARKLGAHTVAITNQMGSQITREVDSVLLTRTGLEVGVAASKTFTAQVGLMYLIGLELARASARCRRGRDRVHPQPGLEAAAESADVPRRKSPDRRDHRQLLPVSLLPLPRPSHRPADRARGCAQAEGDLVHPDRGLLGRRDEARADRAPGRNARRGRRSSISSGSRRPSA